MWANLSMEASVGTFFCWALKGRKDLSCREEWERAMEVFLSAPQFPGFSLQKRSHFS